MDVYLLVFDLGFRAIWQVVGEAKICFARESGYEVLIGGQNNVSRPKSLSMKKPNKVPFPSFFLSCCPNGSAISKGLSRISEAFIDMIAFNVK